MATVALGLGGTAASYSVVRGVLWSPLPYVGYDRLVHLCEARPGQGPDLGVLVSIPTFEDWKRESRLIEDFARMPTGPIVDFILAGDGAARELIVHRISADVMRMFGTPPTLGRGFGPDDEVVGRNRVFLLSHSFWRRHFDGAEDVLGRELRFKRGIYTIIGVMPKGFEYPPAVGSFIPSEVAGWVPATTDPATVSDRLKPSQYVFGRLKPGVTEEQARDEMVAITERLSRLHPEKKGWGVRLIGVHSRFHKYSQHKTMLLTLFAGFAGRSGRSIPISRWRSRRWCGSSSGRSSPRDFPPSR